MTKQRDPRDVLYHDYPNLLSDGAYKVLLRLIYASNRSTGIEYSSLLALNRELHLDAAHSDSTWLELSEQGFVTIRDKRSLTSYRLNSQRIINDCGDVEIGRLKIVVKTNDQSSNDIELGDELVETSLKQMFKEEFDKQLSLIVSESIRKMVSYYRKADKTFTIVEFKKLVDRLAIYNSSTVKEACTIYNENKEMHTTKGWRYLLAVAKNVDAEAGKSKKRKFARAGYTIVAGRESKKTTNSSAENLKMKDESNDKFALKLVTGNVESSRVYKRLLDGDHGALVDLWNRGLSLLKAKGELGTVHYDYEWLGKKRMAGHNVR